MEVAELFFREAQRIDDFFLFPLVIGIDDLSKLKKYREDKLAIKLFNEKIKGSFIEDEKIKERMTKG